MIGDDKASCLTVGIKSSKETLFFLNQEGEAAEPSSKVDKKAPIPKNASKGNGSPTKSKIVGGKMLRNKTRSAAQEVVETTSAKIAEHQKELHARLQSEGITKYSEGGSGPANREGKGWKRFQSYKGEAGLPREAEGLRVSAILKHIVPSLY